MGEGLVSSFSLTWVLIILVVFQGFKICGGSAWEVLTTYRTVNGHACLTPCERREKDFYWCYTQKSDSKRRDSHGSWAYCSPEPGLTYKGTECTTPCENYSDYYFCYITKSKKKWEYCSPLDDTTIPSLIISQYYTRYGKPCLSACSNQGYSYSWCYTTDGSWDYCSEIPGYDINGKECQSKNCDYHEGKSFTWCRLLDQKNGWNYCGQRSVSSETKYTYTGSTCVTPCVMDRDGTINRCYDAAKEKKECSRTPYTATNNLKCHSTCDTRGGSNDGELESFNWCWTSEDKNSAWSKCSRVRDALEYNRSNNRKHYFRVTGIDLRLTQSGSLENIFVLVDDQGNSRVNFLERLEKTGNDTMFWVDFDNDLQRWSIECLASWRGNGYMLSLQNNVKLAVAGTANFGVNLIQGSRYARNEMEYVNLILKLINVADEVSATTGLIAKVLVPVDVIKQNPELMVDAFLRSIFEHCAVFIGTFKYASEVLSGNAHV